MDSFSKRKGDAEVARLQRKALTSIYLNHYLERIQSKFIFTPEESERGFYYWFFNIEEPDKRIKIHFRNTSGLLYLKKPSRHTNTEEFLDSENDSVFVFYETLGKEINGRVGPNPVTVAEVRRGHFYTDGGEGNENRIEFLSYPLVEVKCQSIGSEVGFFSTDIIDQLIKMYNRRFGKE